MGEVAGQDWALTLPRAAPVPGHGQAVAQTLLHTWWHVGTAPPVCYLGSCSFQAEGECWKLTVEGWGTDSYLWKGRRKKPKNTPQKNPPSFFYKVFHFPPQCQHTNLVNVARHSISPLVILYIQASRMDHKLALYGFNISIASHILCKWRYLPWQALLWSTVLLYRIYLAI